MARELDTKLDKPVVAILKKNMKVADKIAAMVDAGVPRNQVSLYLYRLEHVADPTLDLTKKGTVKGKALEKAIVKARTEDQLRFERIAYRAGLVVDDNLGGAVTEVKEILERNDVDPGAYVGRGRRFDGSITDGGKKTTTTSTSSRRGSGRRGTSTGTSGRRAAATKSETAAPASGRRGRGKAAEAETAEQPKATGRRGRRGTRANPK